MNLKWVADHFQTIEIGVIIAVLAFGLFHLRDRSRATQFKVREADRPDLDRILSGPSIADARLRSAQSSPPKAPPLGLPGIRLSGEPHEILGVAPDASESEIMKAYKDAIKRYHPDRIQGQAQEQIRFYQEASAKLNEAKETLIKKRRG